MFSDSLHEKYEITIGEKNACMLKLEKMTMVQNKCCKYPYGSLFFVDITILTTLLILYALTVFKIISWTVYIEAWNYYHQLLIAMCFMMCSTIIILKLNYFIFLRSLNLKEILLKLIKIKSKTFLTTLN